MKALLCKTLDGPDALVIEDIDAPVAKSGEVVVHVSAVALNFFDTLITRGKYQQKPPLPFSPGGEVAGVIASLGAGVDGLAVGQRVLAYVGYNGCREEIAVPAAAVIPLPDGVSDEAAAALPIAYGTALHALQDRARVKAGETVLVLGATGGTGLAAVEIAVEMGARVIAAGTSDEKLKVCTERGAHHVLNLKGIDLRAALKDLSREKGVDVIYDCIGDVYAEPALRSMAWGGRYLVIGFAAGDIPKIPLNLVLLKGCEVVGVFWGQHVQRDPQAFRGQMAQLLDWCARGAVRPHIDETFVLNEVPEALRLLEARQIKGKAIVRLR